MAGNTAASNLEGFVYTSMNSIYQAALSFTSQNMGAGNQKRISQILWRCLVLVTVIGGIFGCLMVLFSPHLLGIYSSDAEVIAYGIQRLKIICLPYFLLWYHGGAGGKSARVWDIRVLAYAGVPGRGLRA